jgi:hypothetical protein
VIRRALGVQLAGSWVWPMMPRRVVRVGASGADFLETSSIVGKRCFKLRRSLPPLDGDIGVSRLVFDAKTYAPDFLGRQNGRTRTCKLVEHHVTTRRTIEKRIGDERDKVLQSDGRRAPPCDLGRTC